MGILTKTAATVQNGIRADQPAGAEKSTTQDPTAEKLAKLQKEFVEMRDSLQADLKREIEDNERLAEQSANMEKVIFLMKPCFDVLIDAYRASPGIFRTVATVSDKFTMITEVVEAAIREADKVAPMVALLREVGGTYDFSKFCFDRNRYLAAVADVTGLGYLISDGVGPDDYREAALTQESEESDIFNPHDGGTTQGRHPRVFLLGGELHELGDADLSPENLHL